MPIVRDHGDEDRLARPPRAAGRRGSAAAGELRLAADLSRRPPPRDLRRRARRRREADLWVVDLATEQASRLTFAPGARALSGLVSGRPEPRLPVRPRRRLRSLDPALERRRRRAGALRVAHRLEGPAELGRRHARLRDSRCRDRLRRLASPAGSSRGSRRVHLLHTPASESTPQISPDGRWLAFASNESGRSEIYVVSLPDAKIKYQVTTEGGRIRSGRGAGASCST